tara:strand:+ start:336 stop:1094 length:759 start_codon:yes stop_codon:yes gene_type:complete
MSLNSKPLILNCYTTDATVYNNAKINYATKFMPNWFKKTPNEVALKDGTKVGTIKNCHGITEMYRTAIVIPCWTEFTLDILHKDEEDFYRWRTAKSNFEVKPHPHVQYKKFAGKNGASIKLVSPWMFQCDEEVNFVWHQPTWNMRDILDKLTLLPATVDYYTQHATEINYFLVRRDFERQVVLKALEPLVMLQAMDARRVEIKNHLITQEEWNTRFRWHFELGGNTDIATRENRLNRIALQKRIEYLNAEKD